MSKYLPSRIGLALLIFLSLSSQKILAQSSDHKTKAQTLENLLEKEDLPDSLVKATHLELLDLYENAEEYSDMAEISLSYYRLPSEQSDTQEEKKKILLRALSYSDKIENSTLLGNLYLKLGGTYFSLIQMDSAILSYSTAIVSFGQADSILVADSFYFRAQAQDAITDMIPAMIDYQRALSYYESLGDESYAGFVRASMAVQFSRYAIYDEADKIREELIEQTTASGEMESLGIQYFNRATDQGKQGDIEGQVANLLLADSLLRVAKSDSYFLTQSSLAISRAYGKVGNLEKQKDYFDRSVALMAENSDFNTDNANYLMSEASLNLSQGMYAKAEKISKKLIEMIRSNGDFDQYLFGLEILAQAQEKQGRPSEALETYRDFRRYKDSIFVANQAKSFAYYQTLYETEKKEVELLRKESEVQNLLTENKENLAYFSIALVSILFLGGFGFLAMRLKSERKKKAAQELYSRELLKTQEDERKRISKDLHDGLGQSLLLIKNKIALNPSDHTGEMLDTAINELRAIARSLHPMQLEKLGLSKALEQMLGQIDEETEIFISSEIDEVKDLLPKEIELQLYRISQEVLNNVLKHSEAQAVRFVLTFGEGKLKMLIEDNGKGFDFSERYNDFQSLGLKTLKERTAAIGGQMKVISEKGKGSKFEFSLNV